VDLAVINWHTVFIRNNAKCWTQVAYVIATYKIATADITKLSTEIFLGWFGVVAGIELFKRAIAAKLEQPNRGGWNERQDCGPQGLSQRTHRGIRPDGSREAVPGAVRRGDDEGPNLQAVEGVVR
jgi:hypothetical protein